MSAALGLRSLHAVRRFRSMNTDVEVRAADPADAPLLIEAERVFEDMERRFSRFLPDSETSALNARDEDTVRVSPDMAELLELSLALHRETGGIFDPAVLPCLAAAGYDRSFELVHDRPQPPPRPPARRGAFRAMRIERGASRVTLPPGITLDFGGIGKGFAVDRASEAIGARRVLINAGGDMYARGEGWRAAVENPVRGGDSATVWLRDEALATSTSAVRRWRAGGREMHHVIDPRTGEPARSGIVSASVIGPAAAVAEVYAKSALILGVDDGWRLLEKRGLAGLFVLEDGSIATNGRWRNHEET